MEKMHNCLGQSECLMRTSTSCNRTAETLRYRRSSLYGQIFCVAGSHIIVAMLLKNFDFQATDPSYVMETESALTIKPADNTMHATRGGIDPRSLERCLWGGKETSKADARDQQVDDASAIKKKPMTFLLGSNTSTCEVS